MDCNCGKCIKCSQRQQMPREEFLKLLYKIQTEAIENVEEIREIFRRNGISKAVHDLQVVLDLAKKSL